MIFSKPGWPPRFDKFFQGYFKGFSRVLTCFQGFSRLKIKGSQGFLMKFYQHFQGFSRVLTKKIQGFFQGIFKTKKKHGLIDFDKCAFLLI